MRVAYVSLDPGVPVFGTKGSSVHVQAVLRRLLARGAHVHLVTTRPGGTPPPDLEAVRVHQVPVAEASGAAGRERALAAADAMVALILATLVTDEGPVDLLYERYSLWGRTATAWARRHGVSSVLEVNAPLIDEQARHRVLVDRAQAEDVARAAFASADAIVCVSDHITAWARSLGAPAERSHTVENGVDTSRIRPAVEPGGPFTIGFVGTLKPWHGVDNLVHALAMLRAQGHDHRLLLVGDGPERGAILDLIDRIGVAGAVEMTGAVAPTQVPSLLRRMHVAVAPYPPMSDFYFSPLKVYEYLSAGLPVVASSVGQLAETLGHGRLGLLVEPGDPAAVAAAISSLADQPARRAWLGAEARTAAVACHDWAIVVDRILTLAGVHLVAL